MSTSAAPPHPPGQPYVQPSGPPPYLGTGWEPKRPRSRRTLILCHIGMLIHFPLHVAMLLAVFALVLALSLVGEFVFAVLFFLEKPALRALDRVLGYIPIRPQWWATWRELRHEGEPGFPRTRIEEVLNGEKPKSSIARLRAHLYRGIGPSAALEIAASLGWQLDGKVPARPKAELNLSRLPSQGVPSAAKAAGPGA
ncbi:hypothetical protein [Streptomyces chrestomyceticus]|uniref:hypothetical protein n=1 Tax=Streptomyces chrestomyceticus TaxID=68185 RepID=UPI0037B40066